MGRHRLSHVSLPDGRNINYSLKKRGKLLRIVFNGPDGRRQELSTGRTVVGEARDAAKRLIPEAFATKETPKALTQVTWDDAIKHLQGTPDLRPDSIRGYLCALNALRKMFPDLAGPADVTTEIAHQFKRGYLNGTYTRGKASDSKTYKRTATSCASYLRALRSLWKKHFKPHGLVKENPWLDVPYPNAPKGKRVRVPSEEVIRNFFIWLIKEYPTWELPRLWVTVKMLAGCRTLDLCKVRSFELSGKSLLLSGEVTKTREARTVKLPDDVAADLRRLAGPTWLWEQSLADTKQYRPAPKIKAKTEYSPSTWRWTMQNLFKEFNEGRPKEARLRPHDLRARTMTMVADITKSVDQTASEMGVNRQTAQHYIDSKKVSYGSDTLYNLADKLRGETANTGSDEVTSRIMHNSCSIPD